MFLFVRSMAFWQWTSALSFWNSCSLSSWNAHLEVRDCFPSPHYAAPPVSDSAWVVLLLSHIYTHTYADTHTCLHASGIKAIWRWCCCVKGFLLICLSDQNDSADTSLFVLVSLSKSVHACEHVCVCACNRVRANVKPQRRRDNCRHKWFYRFFSCYWKNDRIQVHVYIWNITSEEDMWVYACEKQRIPSVSPHLAYRQTW